MKLNVGLATWTCIMRHISVLVCIERQWRGIPLIMSLLGLDSKLSNMLAARLLQYGVTGTISVAICHWYNIY